MNQPRSYRVTVTACGAGNQQHRSRSLWAVAKCRADIPAVERLLLDQLSDWAYPLWVSTVSQPQRIASPLAEPAPE